MSIINKAAVLNPFNGLTANILEYVPRATTSEFGIVAIGSGINVDHLGRIYLDTQEYSDRLAAIEAQAASSLATQKSEVAAAITQVNLTQSQTITALTLEVSNLKTNLTDTVTTLINSATTAQTELVNRADQLAQDVTDITQQLTEDKATFTQDIQDALDYLKSESSVASALRTPRKINGTDFDGRSDITTNAWGATRTFKIGNKTNSINGTSNVAYSLADIGAFPEVGGTIQGNVEVTGNLSVDGTISATLEGKAASADKFHVARKIQGVDFDGTQDISLPTFTTQTDGLVPKSVGETSTKYLREDGTWVVPTNTTYALLTAANAEAGTATAANSISAKVLKDAILYHTPIVTNIAGNAGTASKLETSRTISLTGGVTGSVSFDGSANASIATTVTGLGAANGIATLDSNGQVPSTQLPSYVDDVLEFTNVAAFPTTGVAGKIYVETTGNTTYRWGGTGYVKITSGEVSSVAGKTGVVTLTKSDVGLTNADNTADSAKNVASATKLTTARTLGGVSFDGTANINLPGVNTTGNQSTTGNASTATTLQTARTINGTSFNGSANITTTNWGTARTLSIGSTGKAVNGSADVSWTLNEILPTATNGQVLKYNGTSWVSSNDNNTPYTALTAEEANTGTATTERAITAAVLKGAIQTHAPVQTSVIGNAGTATKLQTPRTINGIEFDGSSNIDIYIPESEAYVLPTATDSVLGGIKIGNGLSIAEGVVSVDTVTTSEFTSTESGLVPASGTGNTKYLRQDGTWEIPTATNTAYAVITPTEVDTGTATEGKLVTAALLKQAVITHAPTVTDITGKAATATKLATARTINGVVFDGTADIQIPSETINATETLAGTAKIATTAIAQAGTNNTDIMTPAKVGLVSFGQGQTRKIRTLVSGVEYTNTSNKPIILGFTLMAAEGTNNQMGIVIKLGDIALMASTISPDYSYMPFYELTVLPQERYTIIIHSSGVTFYTVWEIS